MSELPPIEDDPRFERALEAFNRRDYFDASELFEDLFFEAAGHELEFARMFLQASVGFLHAERGQPRAAMQRLVEGLRAAGRVADHRSVDIDGLRRDMAAAVEALQSGAPIRWPRVIRETLGH